MGYVADTASIRYKILQPQRTPQLPTQPPWYALVHCFVEMIHKLISSLIYLSWSPSLITLFIHDLNHQSMHVKEHVSVCGYEICVWSGMTQLKHDTGWRVFYSIMAFKGITI